MIQTFKRLLADPSGATAIEYGLICALIGLVILLATNTSGQALVAMLTSLVDGWRP
jgi:pilus assembly protein Flp/PilA